MIAPSVDAPASTRWPHVRRWGVWLFVFGIVSLFGPFGYYLIGAQFATGALFLSNMTLWYACPFTLSVGVVLLGGRDGRDRCGLPSRPQASVEPQVGAGQRAGTLPPRSRSGRRVPGRLPRRCAVDARWPGFYYTPIYDGKNLWLLLQAASIGATW